MLFLRAIAATGLYCSLAASAMDLRNAVVFLPSGAESPVKKAAQMLTAEIAKRTQLRREVSNSKPAGGRAVIALETPAQFEQYIRDL